MTIFSTSHNLVHISKGMVLGENGSLADLANTMVLSSWGIVLLDRSTIVTLLSLGAAWTCLYHVEDPPVALLELRYAPAANHSDNGH